MTTSDSVLPPSLDRDATPTGVVTVKGPLTIAAVEQWRGRLADTLARGPLTIDLGDVTAVDVFGLQLLHSAASGAARAGRAFRVVNSPDALTTACSAAGYRDGVLATFVAQET